MGGVGQFAYQGFLIREAWNWCMELDFFSLECNGVSSSEFWDGYMCLV